jgi:hypothetical protein
VLGLGGFATFRYLPRIHRRLPDLRSFAALLGSAVVFGTMASAMTVTRLFGVPTWNATLIWLAATVAAVALFAPPVMFLCPERLWRLRFPIAREDAWRRPAAAEGANFSESSSGFRVGVRSHALRDTLLVIGPVVAIHLLVRTLGPLSPFAHWLFVLYGLPILLGASRHGLRGGLLASSAVSLSLLLSAPPSSGAHDHLFVLERQGGVLLFTLIGAVAGAMRDRERALMRRLERSNRTLRQDLERVLVALRSAMEAKDQYTEGHLRRVCAFALEVGRRLKLRPDELELLEVASLLHDVGKIGIAESILRKPGPLDPRERELMQRHPAIGARILENVEGLGVAATMVRHHQERFDGLTTGAFPGYPDGLAGREIPLGARIIAVVDAFDAMTSDRPYRRAVGLERAKQALREEAGHQFDPRVVETFLRLLEERGWESEPAADEDDEEDAAAS